MPTRIPRLRAVADALGITITYSGAVSEKVLGVYTHDRHDGTGATGQIKLYTLDVATFYHELAHALHHRTGLLREGKSEASKRDNEVVAEISAAVLVRLIEGEEVGRQALQYVTSYGAKKAHLLSLLPEIMGVLDLALELGTTNYDAPVLAVANQ